MTPTLIIHNQQDMRVPVNHGIELFNTLQKRGVPSKLVYFPDENHWVLKPQNSLYLVPDRPRLDRNLCAARRVLEGDDHETTHTAGPGRRRHRLAPPCPPSGARSGR